MVAKGIATLVPEIEAFRVQFENISAEADTLVALRDQPNGRRPNVV